MEMKLPPKVKDLIKKLFTKEKLPIILLIGVLLVVISIPVKKSNNEKEEITVLPVAAGETSYVEELEEKLEGILEKTAGVGKNCVMITVKNTGKEVLYSQKDSSTHKIKENDASGVNRTEESESIGESVLYTDENGVSKPYVQGMEMPEIQGVLIIAEGADKAEVIKAVTEAAGTLLNVSVNKIKVMKMEVTS